MPHLPRLGARAGAAVGRALQLRRMLGVCDTQHLAFTEEFIVVLLGLGVEARVVIGIPGLWAGRRALQCLVEAPNPAVSGVPAPIVVATVGLLVPIADETFAALSLRRKHREEPEQPQTV